MKIILKFLFERYKPYFSSLFVESLVGEMPKEVNDSAIAFLANGKEKLEKWLLWNSYLIHRKAMGDLNNSQYYLGILTHIKILTILVTKNKPTEKIIIENEKSTEKKYEKEIEGVDKFLKAKKVV